MDWIALYAATLSTLLAFVGLWNWWRRDIYLTVHGVHQSQNWFGSDLFALVVTNSGRRPTVVHRIRVEFLNATGRNAKRLGEANFNHASLWNPAQKSEPIEGKSNTSRRMPNVLQPGDELHGNASPIEEYNPSKDFIKITAFARNSRRGFVGWINPHEET